MRDLCEQWFDIEMRKLKRLNNEATTRLVEYWSLKLDKGARRTLYLYMDSSVYSKDWRDALAYIAERYTCWFFNESSSQWKVYNPSAALVWMLRWTFWYDRCFSSAFEIEDFDMTPLLS